jgi:hypothetical protein
MMIGICRTPELPGAPVGPCSFQCCSSAGIEAMRDGPVILGRLCLYHAMVLVVPSTGSADTWITQELWQAALGCQMRPM